jgi:voltage-gated potassium channel
MRSSPFDQSLSPWQRIRITIAGLLFTFSFGTFGYRYLEGWSLLDSLYMTVITLTTVGYSEVHPIERMETRIFTILLILSGMGVVFYTLSTITHLIVEGHIGDLLGSRKVKRAIEKMKHHCIVCGYGRIGQSICHELQKAHVPFVVVEKDPLLIQRLEQEAIPGVLGDATTEEALIEAGIHRARALIPAAHTDADNVYITLTAKSLNPRIFIVARAADPHAHKKLQWAGADRVVSPYQMSGRRMANLILRPNVVEFIEGSLFDPDVDLVIEEILLPDQGPLVGVSLMDSGLRRDYNLIVVAIKRKEGELIINPSPQEVLSSGDILIVLGKRQDIDRLSCLLSPPSSQA